ncbi:TPA: type III secretion system effector protein kinase YopO/YpkA [Yersinia enterocolitica]|uniref:type III secretion system effector protein kinase YopO/YpkA n=2 Tax=Yersinia enterocolitica TaxID=630 RepID=UPI00083E6106|nr:type III secretion system effector protein kinase YopO/YpkA [Yersinia enterocolitica]AOF21264.1 protein kinase [Yersinia enterocolitica]AOF25491.1 protein kinase [Yersinia enterocolitica]AOF37525.1 protein kinase [Yersinia enterocolitica]HDL6968418.1 type III secretion system effector protein kinase YopO/YpkA [Yersinia enterocolitica]HDL6972606.1 type III secretion system effector protein kinase YopO/YpkA [Yersinia enterocolitica]
MKIMGTMPPSISLAKAHERISQHWQNPVGELNIGGKRYRIIDNQVLRLNPHSGFSLFREGVGKIFSGKMFNFSIARNLTETLHAAQKTTSQELRSDIPNVLSNLFGAKPQTELPLGWKGKPLSGAPDLEGMRVAETDKFAEGESHISIIETKDNQRLVAKIERSIAEGHLFAELEAYKHIYKTAGKHPNLANVHGMAVVPYGNRKEEALLMDEVDGWRCSDTLRSLADSWKQGKINSEAYWGTIKFIAHRLLDVTNHLAKAGIVHNDIKPGNVVFDRASGEPVVIDLGLHSRSGEQPKGFTESFKAPELGVGNLGASEKSDVFLVVSTLLHGIEGFEKDPEIKPNQGLRSITSEPAHVMDENGYPIHRPGIAGVETAYTRFITDILGVSADSRPDSNEARLHEFLSDGTIDEESAKQILKDTLTGEMSPLSTDVRRITPKKLRELSDLLRTHLSSAATKQLDMGVVLSDLDTMLVTLDKAEREGGVDKDQLKSFNSLILKTYSVIEDYVKGREGDTKSSSAEVSPYHRSNFMLSIVEPSLQRIQKHLDQTHSFSDIGSLVRAHKHLETLLEVLVTLSPQGQPVSSETYSFLNRLAEAKVTLSQQLDTLQQQQESAKAQLSILINRSGSWADVARQSLQRFDSTRPVVKFGTEQYTAIHRQMMAAHAAITLQEVSEFTDDMRNFTADSIPLLIRLGRSSLIDEHLVEQREKLRELTTIAERLNRLEREWM